MLLVIFILRLYAIYSRSRAILVSFSVLLMFELAVKIVSALAVSRTKMLTRDAVRLHGWRAFAAATW